MIPKSLNNPLAEVFGFPVNNNAPDIRRKREHKLCPFNNKIPKCTKVSKTDPLGVCTMYHRGLPVITCPIRFREGWLMIADAAEVFFGKGALYTSLPEVRLVDKNGRKAGNIDYVLVRHDERGRILDYASLEVQSVYISGTIKGAFDTYMDDQNPDFEWVSVRNYPNPDYLSSSTKRLIPQMLVKGGIFRHWKRKQAVAVQYGFFNTLPKLAVVPAEEADLAWLLYDLILAPDELRYNLTHIDTVYTRYDQALREFIEPQPDEEEKFLKGLQKAIDAKFSGKSTAEIDILGEDNEAEDDEL